MAYASVADFENYVEAWVTDDADTLERYLERASRDIDRLVGAWPYLASGFKFDLTETDADADGYLAAYQQTAVINATCAQAYYRIKLDEARSGSTSSTTVSLPLGLKRLRGPDFELEAASGSSAIGSTLDATYPASMAALSELEGTGLIRRTLNGSISTAGYDTDGNPVFS